MPSIKKLSLSEVQKIAAGEVIERPCHIVKELVENALDAQATDITVTIKNGGRDLIRVADNGVGMDRDDALLCFEHHATSKINSFYDIETVMTHGFRGEALTTIAAVSTVTLTTKTATVPEGIKVTVCNGIIQDRTPCAHTQGTLVTVTDLFGTVPVRKKFLKSRETEMRHIYSFMRACALIYPDKDFTLIGDDARVLECRGAATVRDRAALIFNESVYKEHIITIERESKYGRIEGIITNHHTYRYDRSGLFFFVNKRWIKNNHVARALLRGYGSVLPPGRYPLCALALTVKTNDVDINSHPRKEEVRFLHEQGIENLIKDSVTDALESHITRIVAAAPPLLSAHAQEKQEFKPFPFTHALQPPSHVYAQAPTQAPKDVPFCNTDTHGTALLRESVHVQMSYTEKVPELYTLIGQLHATYILVEHEKGLALIDQHAAHERILYEQMAQRVNTMEPIQLLFPLIISLSADLYQEIAPYYALFSQHGIIAEPFGERCVKIAAVPPCLKNVAWEPFFNECAASFGGEKNNGASPEEIVSRITHALRAQIACKGAVKAGDILVRSEMEKIVNDLTQVNNRFSCPHGRPTTFLYTLYELEKKFRRVGA